MSNLMDYPLVTFILSFLVLAASARIGLMLRKRQRPMEDAAREDFSNLQNATLTLLALIIGFSFSMAINRYDQRKTYEEEEANAIGTEYARADQLPAADAGKVHALLVSYLDQRVLFFTSGHGTQLQQIDAEVARLQTELWTAIQEPVAKQPSPVTALVLSGMNDVLDAQGYTQSAYFNRIPPGAWILLMAMAIYANVLVAFGSRSKSTGTGMLLALPLLVSIAVLLIADIDSPHGGLINIHPQNLLSLAQSLHK